MQITIHIKHRAQKQLGLMSKHVMHLDTAPICMWYRRQQRLGRHPMIPTQHHYHLN